MYLCGCMYVYMCMYVYICVRAYTSVCVSFCVCTRARTCACVCMFVYIKDLQRDIPMRMNLNSVFSSRSVKRRKDVDTVAHSK